ncbi:hypothetical protein DW018_00655 [Eubacterium ventriosum]|uniref:ApeA N-terminal domain-containing protein n=1 Tax=Eubacterium ventriosum TaxID=39496 RepID=A0A415LHM2_9FIRM|nr:hypothetical protein [Eubacterium ventriosum]RHL47971.1 hypothetical protein DW018_00655 [Eubacterium ventriosum]
MALDLELYTGTLEYKDILFGFVFDKKELRLIPPKDKKRNIHQEWFMRELQPGLFTNGNPPIVEVPFLIGKCNENGQKIIFITQEGSAIGCYNSVLLIDIVAYIECKYNRGKIDRIAFSGPEINSIHPVGQGFSYSLTEEYWDKGIISIQTNNFDDTTTNSSKFTVDGKEVEVHFGITRGIRTGIVESPLNLESTMTLDFEETDDYLFVYRLYNISKRFIQFLNYRRKVIFTKVTLSAPYEGEKHESFALLHVLRDSDNTLEEKPLKDKRIIQLNYLEGNEGRILEDIADGTIYTRHLPDSYASGASIDEARFVMITAAFEWEFKRLYPNGIKKKSKKIRAEEAVESEIDKLIQDNTGEIKKIYKSLKRIVKLDSLGSNVVFVCNELDSIIRIFGNFLFGINGEELKYSEMGNRLSTQRNNFAHGNLDKKFVGNSLLDLLFLEEVIYAMQLNYYGVTKYSIQMAIKDLFHENIMIYEKEEGEPDAN